jgi:murein DD-endopeptidase MepM/ murein hydrolase activator NlpD
LYAHLLEPVGFSVGDEINCGTQLGIIGNSGNALNPHLHIELRVGPSGSRFPGMSHYNSSATPLEMAGYCLWRVSGKFQALNPIDLFPISLPP